MAPSIPVFFDDSVYEQVLRSAPAETIVVRNELDAPSLMQAVFRYCPPLYALTIDGFVAGGFVRDVVLGVAPRDLDVYLRTQEATTTLEAALRTAGWVLDRTGMISTSWRDPRGHLVQVIRAPGESASQCIQRFDLTICCAAIDLQTRETFCSSTFLSDVNQKLLVINKPAFPVDTLRRIALFVKDGYSIASDQLQVLHGCVLRELHSQGINAFRPSQLL